MGVRFRDSKLEPGGPLKQFRRSKAFWCLLVAAVVAGLPVPAAGDNQHQVIAVVGSNVPLPGDLEGFRGVEVPTVNGAADAELIQLSDIQCTARAFCHVIGSYRDGGGLGAVVVGTWANETTTLRPLAAPIGGSEPELSKLSCAGSSSCAAIGTFVRSDGNRVPMVATLTGSAWAATEVTLPVGTTSTWIRLSSVSCGAPGFCAAVGDFQSDLPSRPLVVDIVNGSVLTTEVTMAAGLEDPKGLKVTSVSCSGQTFCAAVGGYTKSSSPTEWIQEALVFERSGTGWVGSVPTSAPGAQNRKPLTSVACVSPGECFAAGAQAPGPPYPQPDSFVATVSTLANGTWSTDFLPTVSGSYNTVSGAVACATDGLCLMTGSSRYSGSTAYVLNNGVWIGSSSHSMRDIHCSPGFCKAVDDGLWTFTSSGGASWGEFLLPRDSGSYLTALSCTTADSCTAVGRSTWVVPVPGTTTGQTITYGNGVILTSDPIKLGGPVSPMYVDARGPWQVDQTVYAYTGVWGPTPVMLSYQWNVVPQSGVTGGPIPGATSDSYRISGLYHGKRLTVTITGKAPGFNSVSKTTPPSEQVVAAFLKGPKPTFTGQVKIGSTLTAKPYRFNQTGSTSSYQWLLDDHPIPGATGSTLVVPNMKIDAWEARHISLSVIGKKLGYHDQTFVSAEQEVFGRITAGTPTVAGEARAGKVLTVRPGTWGPNTVDKTYQWLVDGKPASGQTRTSFTVPTSAIGKRISVRVTGSKDNYFYQYATEVRTSAQTRIVVGRAFTAPTPKITGTAKVGTTLTATAGWTPSPTAYRYQWRLDGRAVAGATSKTWKLPSSATGKKVSVTITGSRSGYATLTKPSLPTSAVRAG